MKHGRIILLSLLFFLTACAVSPQRLGFSKSEWESMSKEKQAELLDNYKQLQALKKPRSGEEEKGDSESKDVAAVTVLIAKGKVMMPPFTEAYPYEPVSFRIQEGNCQQVLLRQTGGKHKVEMEACFKKGILLLDPSRYDTTKLDSSARLYHSLLWRNGFNYVHVNSTGYVRLQDVSIRVQE